MQYIYICIIYIHTFNVLQMAVGTTCHHGSFFRGRGTWSNRSGCEMPKVEILPRNLGEGLDKMDDLGKCSKHLLRLYFPTYQVRVVRFYQSCSPPPRLAVLLLVLLLLRLLLQFLLDHVCINFHLHFRLSNSAPSSLPTLFAKLFANFPAQCAPLDLNLGPAQLSVHRWTSTAR